MGKRKGRSSGTSSPRSITVTPESKRPSNQMTPETKCLNFTSDNTMAGARPKIIRTSNEDIIKDKCALTEVLDTLRHDKTSSVGKYEYNSLKCHTEGLEEYKTHWDTFVNTLGDYFFQELSKWLSAGIASLENFKANFDWGSVQNSVKINLS